MKENMYPASSNGKRGNPGGLKARIFFALIANLLAGCVLLSSGGAYADTATATAQQGATDLIQKATCPADSLFCIEPDDYSLMWLRTAFPELVTAITGTNSGGAGQPDGSVTAPDGAATNNLLFAELMKMLNSAALAVASILLSYKILAGVVQTANDGEVLGKRWSTLWGPLRVITAAGLLVPTASGYSLIQAVIIGIALTGIGFANGAWRVVVDSMVKGGVLTAPPTNNVTITLARQVLANNICMHAINMLYADMVNAGADKANPYGQPEAGGEANANYPWGWGSITADSYKGSTNQTVTLSAPAVFRSYNAYDPLSKGPLEFKMIWKPPAGMNGVYGLSDGICGSATIRRSNPNNYNKSPKDNYGAYSPSSNKTVPGFAFNGLSVDESGAVQYQQGLLKIEADALDHMARDLDGPALTIVRNWYPFGDQGSVMPDMKNRDTEIYNDLISTFINAATKYENEVSTARQAYRGQFVKDEDFKAVFRDYALTRGWASAGEWYITMAKMNELAQALDDNQVAVTEQPNIKQFLYQLSSRSSEESERFADLANLINRLPEIMAKSGKPISGLNNGGVQAEIAQKFKNQLTNSFRDNDVSGWEGFLRSFQELLSNTVEPLLSGVASGAGAVFGLPLDPSAPNPLMTITWGGRRLFYTGLGIYISNISGGQAAVGNFIDEKVSEAGGGVKGAFWKVAGGTKNVVSPVISLFNIMAFPFMIVPGALMGYVLPMLPWVLWVSALLGWFILVVESVIAGPLWALAHMRMDGEGIAGPMGEQGYRLALSVMLRPMLMVVGLIAGLVVLTIFIPFIGASIWVAEVVNDGAGVAQGFFTRLVTIVLQSFLMVYVCYRSFNLITHVPDRVLRWIGHGGEGLGESEPVEQAKALFIGGIGSFGGGIGRVAGAATGGGGSPGGGDGGKSQGEVSKGAQNRANESQTRIL